jgi:hypothetical protein
VRVALAIKPDVIMVFRNTGSLFYFRNTTRYKSFAPSQCLAPKICICCLSSTSVLGMRESDSRSRFQHHQDLLCYFKTVILSILHQEMVNKAFENYST